MVKLNNYEQEQFAQLKYFWRDWGKYVFGILILVLVGYVSSVIWDDNAAKRANQAAILYDQFTDALGLNDTHQMESIVSQMVIKYPKVEYTTMASISIAKQEFTTKNYDLAAGHLLWVIANTKDNGMKALASLRLADVYIDQKKFNEALTLLLSNTNSAFSILFYSKRGDLYVAKGELDKARDAYKEAIQKAGQDSNMTSVIQLKLDALGS